MQSDVSQHPVHQPKQCPAPPLRKPTLSMAATILLAVSVCLVCGAMCVATAFAAEPVAERDEPSTPSPSWKAVRHGNVVAQRWVSVRPKWHQWWSCYAASVKASWRKASTAASYCAAKGIAAVMALGHILCAAASSVPAVTAAGMARFEKVCSAAKCWVTIAAICCQPVLGNHCCAHSLATPSRPTCLLLLCPKHPVCCQSWLEMGLSCSCSYKQRCHNQHGSIKEQLDLCQAVLEQSCASFQSLRANAQTVVVPGLRALLFLGVKHTNSS